MSPFASWSSEGSECILAEIIRIASGIIGRRLCRILSLSAIMIGKVGSVEESRARVAASRAIKLSFGGQF